MQDENRVSHLDELADLEGEWNEIHQSSLSKSPFVSFDYINMWYATFASPSDVRVYRVRAGDETIGFMPLVLCRKQRLRELCNLINEHCLLSQALVKSGREQDFQRLFLLQLLATRKDWDVFRYKFSYSFSLLPGLFDSTRLEKTGKKWRKTKGITYSIILNKSYEEYCRNDLSSNMRKNLRYANNRISKNEEYIFFHIQGHEAIQYWPIFLELEGSGWKGIGGTAIVKTDEPMQSYYSKLVNLLACTGNLHLYFLRVNGKIIAGSFGYTDGSIYQEAKSAYNEEYGEFSPSTLLRMYMIADIVSLFPSIQRIHMFPWDYGYKHRFSNEHAEYIETIIYNTTLRGLVAYLLSKLKNKMREKYPHAFKWLQLIYNWLQCNRT